MAGVQLGTDLVETTFQSGAHRGRRDPLPARNLGWGQTLGVTQQHGRTLRLGQGKHDLVDQLLGLLPRQQFFRRRQRLVGLVGPVRTDPTAAARRQAGLAQLAASRGSLRIFGLPEPGANLGGTAAGKVQDPDGAPVPGAVVSAARAAGSGLPGAPPGPTPVKVRAGIDGSFAITGLSPGQYRLVATAPQFAAAESAPVAIAPGQTAADVVITLGRAGFTLSGNVADSGGGIIAGATLGARLPNGGWAMALADAQGQVALRLPPATYTLVVDADGYAPLRTSASLVGDLRRQFRLHPAGRIVGRVLDQGAAVAGALVRAEVSDRSERPDHVQTDAEGGFRFADLNPGRYQLSASKGAQVGFLAAPVAVTQAGTSADIVIALEPAFTISGQVNGPDGKPVASAQIVMEEAIRLNQGVSAFSPVLSLSEADGRYRVEGVLPGRYRIGARAAPHAPALLQEIAIQDRSLDQIDFALSAGAAVRGTVRGPDGKPVAGAQVGVSVQEKDVADGIIRGGGRTRSGPDGQFALDGLGAGVLRAKADHDDFGSVELVVGLAPGEHKDVTLTFNAPAFVTGTVRWDDGAPALGTRVRWNHYGRGGRAPTLAMVAADGSFRLGPFEAGDGVAQAELAAATALSIGGHSGPHQKRLSARPGQTTTDVALVMAKPDQSIAGVVLGPDQRPVPDSSVIAFQRSSQGGRGLHGLPQGEAAQAAGDGSFTIGSLPRGKYTLVATHPLHPDAELADVTAGSTGVRLRFNAGATIAGKAVSPPGGRPVSDYTVAVIPAESPGEHNGHSSGRDIGTRQSVRGPNGGFSFERLAPGKYDLVLTTADGGAGRLAGLVLAAGEKRRHLQIPVGVSTTITGQVVAMDTGKGIPDLGVGVQGTRDHVHARTDAQGRFAIERQVGGRTLVLFVRAREGFLPEQRELTLPEAAPVHEIAPIRLLPRPSDVAGDTGAATPGFSISARGAPATIELVQPDSPAARAGLRPGDLVRSVDGQDVSQWGMIALGMRLRGAAGSKLNLVVESAGSRRSLALERAP